MSSGNGVVRRSPTNGRKRLAERRRGLGQPADDRRIVDHPAHDGSEVGEPARADLHADRVAHDVLELVRLVDHDHVVLGQQHAAAGDVEAVEVEVDDDDVGDRGPASGPARRSTRRPSGTFVPPGHSSLPTLTACHDRVGGRPVEVGLVAGLGRAGPLARAA